MSKKYGIIIFLVITLLILIFHFFFLHWLGEKNIVSVILSPGPHSQGTAILITIIFFIVRIFTIVFLPAIFLYLAGSFVCRFILDKMR